MVSFITFTLSAYKHISYDEKYGTIYGTIVNKNFIVILSCCLT